MPGFLNPHRPFPEAAVQCIFFRRQWTPRGARPCPYRSISRAAGSAPAAGRTHGTKESWKWGGATVAKYCRLHGGKSTGRYKGVSTNLVPTIFCYQREKTKDWEVVRRASAAPPDDEPFPPPLLSKSPSFSQSCGGSRPWSKKGNLQRTNTKQKRLLRASFAGGRRIYF